MSVKLRMLAADYARKCREYDAMMERYPSHSIALSNGWSADQRLEAFRTWQAATMKVQVAKAVAEQALLGYCRTAELPDDTLATHEHTSHDE